MVLQGVIKMAASLICNTGQSNAIGAFVVMMFTCSMMNPVDKDDGNQLSNKVCIINLKAITL
jgi:hypothetical protein